MDNHHFRPPLWERISFAVVGTAIVLTFLAFLISYSRPPLDAQVSLQNREGLVD